VEKLADGRVRSFPHVDGNFPGFVFLSLARTPGLLEAAVEAVKLAKPLLGQGRTVHMLMSDEFHISLSRTFAVRRHQIEPMVQQLRMELRSQPEFGGRLEGVGLYTNDERTRSFVGLRVSSGQEKISSLVRGVDRVMGRHKLQAFWPAHDFHVSVAWAAGDLPSEAPAVVTCAEGDARAVGFSVPSVRSKIGARSYTFRLRSK